MSTDFQVVVAGAHGSEEDWKRALTAETAGAGMIYPAALAEERIHHRGEKLGEQVKSVLAVLGQEYHLSTVMWEGFRNRWLIRIRSPRGISEMPIPAELGDGVAESATMDDLERLKNLILFGAGRTDLIFKRTS